SLLAPGQRRYAGTPKGRDRQSVKSDVSSPCREKLFVCMRKKCWRGSFHLAPEPTSGHNPTASRRGECTSPLMGTPPAHPVIFLPNMFCFDGPAVCQLCSPPNQTWRTESGMTCAVGFCCLLFCVSSQ